MWVRARVRWRWRSRAHQKEEAMQRITEVDEPGLAVRAFYKIGERMFGALPTPERIMAHRVPLMLGIGGLWGSMEWFATVDKTLRALVQLHVAKLYGSVY
jgi:hypothetical protein